MFDTLTINIFTYALVKNIENWYFAIIRHDEYNKIQYHITFPINWMHYTIKVGYTPTPKKEIQHMIREGGNTMYILYSFQIFSHLQV